MERKSGVNLHLSLTGETYDGTFVGVVEVIATQQVPLTFDLPDEVPEHDSGVLSVPCWQVLIQADPANNYNALIGNEAQGCHIILRPGESITIPINDVKKIFARAATGAVGAVRLVWIAMI